MTWQEQDNEKLLRAFLEWLGDAAHIFLDEAERDRLIAAFLKTREIK